MDKRTICFCQHRHSIASSEASYCSECGLLIEGTRRIVIRPVPLRTALVPKARPLDQKRLAPLRQEQQRFSWRELSIYGVAWAFVVSVVLGVAAALDAVGTTPQGLALVGVPVVGALLAEASWLNGHWRSGLAGMVLWEGLLWLIAFSTLFV